MKKICLASMMTWACLTPHALLARDGFSIPPTDQETASDGAILTMAEATVSDSPTISAGATSNLGHSLGTTSGNSSTGGCSTGGCKSSCGTGCGKGGCCIRHNRWTVFGDFLYMRPSDTEVAYALPVDGVTPGVFPSGVPRGPAAVVDPDYEPGFRLGFAIPFDNCGALVASYSRLETNDGSAATIDAPFAPELLPLVVHPDDTNIATSVVDANATLDVDFDQIDLDYSVIWSSSNNHALNFFGGARFANLEQSFEANFNGNGTTTVLTDVDFSGGGLGFGLSGERYGCLGLTIYGRAEASFLAGEFNGRYESINQLAQQTTVLTTWESGRVVSILEAELGVGWTSPSRRIHVRGGYMVHGWFNTVKVDEFINAAQRDDFDGLTNPMAFDGFNVRAEYRF